MMTRKDVWLAAADYFAQSREERSTYFDSYTRIVGNEKMILFSDSDAQGICVFVSWLSYAEKHSIRFEEDLDATLQKWFGPMDGEDCRVRTGCYWWNTVYSPYGAEDDARVIACLLLAEMEKK